MSAPNLTSPPDLPLRSDPSTFAARTEALFAWWPTNLAELRAMLGWIEAQRQSVDGVANLAAAALQMGLSSALVSQLSAIKQQTEEARDAALAGLGVADNSQALAEMLGAIGYAVDMAGQAVREIVRVDAGVKTYDQAIEAIAYALTAALDLAGVTARAVSGGEVVLGAGAAGTPSLSAAGGRDTGVFFPAANSLALATGGVARVSVDGSGHVATGTDNGQTLGTASKRWSTVYAGTGTINTSDAREKTPVTPLDAAEIAAAKALAAEIGTYQFVDAVARKGDGARRHVGLTVQRAIEIMEVHGLDPFRYGFICHDAWPELSVEHPASPAVPEVLDEAGSVVQAAVPAVEAWTEIVQEAGDRYAFRNDQLNLFIAAGFEARLSALEARTEGLA